MRLRLHLLLPLLGLSAAMITLALPRTALAGTYTGTTVECNGTCPEPNQHCTPKNVSYYPVICSGNGTCPLPGPLGCHPGTPCGYMATWDCKCQVEGGGLAGDCSRF